MEKCELVRRVIFTLLAILFVVGKGLLGCQGAYLPPIWPGFESCTWHGVVVPVMRPSKGFERQATLRQNVATICYQSTDSRQKLTWKGRQFAKTTIHFSFRQSDNCTFFLRRRHDCHDCHDLTRPAWLFWSSIVCVYGRSVVQILTKTNHHSTLFTKS